MKGLILAGAATVACAVAITVLFRTVRITHRAAAMTRLFGVTLVVLVVAYVTTPADLGVLPAALVEPRPVVELALAVVVACALFFGGLLQLYNLADRGFSLRLLIDLDENPRGVCAPTELIESYGGGQGMRFMLDKRIDGLVKEGLLVIDHAEVRPSARGARAGRLFGTLRALLRLDARS